MGSSCDKCLKRDCTCNYSKIKLEGFEHCIPLIKIGLNTFNESWYANRWKYLRRGGGMGKRLKFMMMIGNIGTGKSSLAVELLKKNKDSIVLSKDGILNMVRWGEYEYDELKPNFYFQTEENLILESIKCGLDIILDRTNMSKEKRKYYIDLVAGKAHIICYDFGIGTMVDLYRRLEKDKGISPSECKNIYDKFRDEYEPPQKNERIDRIVTMVTKTQFKRIKKLTR